ncbi:hypothetical protein ACIU1J_04380 [Azospirillum doebereinerae]|uniref:hypothetical protein n=1 Tax=Azospirillum doebereinerae TaxID=92933 RepID=UPI00384EDFC7
MIGVSTPQRPPHVDPPAAVGEVFLHGAALQQFHDQIGGAVLLEEVLDADDLLHVAQPGEQARLVEELGHAGGESARVLVGKGDDPAGSGNSRDQVRRVELLDRHPHPQPVVPAQIGGAEPALPQHPPDLVAAEQQRARHQMHARPVVGSHGIAALPAGVARRPVGEAARAEAVRLRRRDRHRLIGASHHRDSPPRRSSRYRYGVGGIGGERAGRRSLGNRLRRRSRRGRHLAQAVQQFQQTPHLGLRHLVVGLGGEVGLELRLANDLQDVLAHQRQRAVLAD